MQNNRWIFGFGILFILAVSCDEIETLSPIPEIEYKSFKYDYFSGINQPVLTRVLEFKFEDGDADLGVYDEVHKNPNFPDSVRYGIFIHFYEKVDGEYLERFFTEETPVDTDSVGIISYRTDTLVFHQQFPYDTKLDRIGQNKTVKGTVRVALLMPAEMPYDTMRFEFYIRDRALHKSNVEYTEDFTNVSDPQTGI